MEDRNNCFKNDSNNRIENRNNINRSNVYSVPSGMTSVSTDRSLVLVRELKNFIGVEEVHCHRSQTTDTVNFIEEHWSSEIKNLCNKKPPKFKKMIQAYRVLASDKLNLSVEVESDPPALFEWTINDKNIVYKQNDKIVCLHGLNLSQIIVKEPEEGIYSCKASNGYGISRSYGYVRVDNDIQKHKKFPSNLKINSEESLNDNLRSLEDKKNLPYFISQIPNLIVDLGSEAVFDIEVDSPTPVQFFWFHNNRRFDENNPNFEFYYPSKHRCLILIKMPIAGAYKVIARNEAGQIESTGYLSIGESTKSDVNEKSYKSLPRNIHRKITNNNTLYFESNFSDKQKLYEDTMERISNNNCNALNENNNSIINMNAFTPIQTQKVQNKISITKNIAQPLPQKPIVDLNHLSMPPSEIHISLGQSLSLEMKVQSSPSSAFKWYHKNFEVKPSPIIAIEEVAENHSKAIFKKPYSGIYKCVASNPHGEAVIETRVTSDYIDEVEIGSLVNGRKSSSNINFTPFNKVNRNIKKKNLPMAPKIIKKFDNLLRVNQNEKTELFVEVESFPPAKFVWRHRHFELKPSKNVVIENDINKSRLILLKPQEGIYEVTAINEIGEDKESCKLVVIYNIEKEVEVFETKKIEEPCFVEKVENVPHFVVVKKNPINEISLIVEIDNKFQNNEYINTQCNVTSRTPEHAVLDMVKRTQDDELNNVICEPFFVNRLGQIKVQEDNKLICEAILNKEAGDKCIFIWFLNGNPISSVFSSSYYDNGQISKLCIPSMTKKMEGELLVIAENVKGVVEMKGQVIVETVNRPNMEILNKREKPNTKKSVEEVVADGIIQNIPQLRNYKDTYVHNDTNKKISVANNSKAKNDVTEIKKQPESYKLLVKVAESIATTLVAKIFVEAMKESSKILAEEKSKSLQKKEKNPKAPYFEVTSEQYTVSDDQNITIHTVIHGSPTPDVLWYFENKELKPSDDGKYSIINTSGHSQLTIKNVDRNKNSGVYYCKASNEFGVAVYSCNLIIIERIYEMEIHNITTQVDVPALSHFESGSEDEDRKSEYIELNIDIKSNRTDKHSEVESNLDDSCYLHSPLGNIQDHYIEVQKNNGENNKLNLPIINIHETDKNENSIFHDVTLKRIESNNLANIIVSPYNSPTFSLSFKISSSKNDNILDVNEMNLMESSINSSRSQEASIDESSFVSALEDLYSLIKDDKKLDNKEFLYNNTNNPDSTKDIANIQETKPLASESLSKTSNVTSNQSENHNPKNIIDLNFKNINLSETNESQDHMISCSIVLEKEKEHEKIDINIVDKDRISFTSPSIHEVLMIKMMQEDNTKESIKESLLKLADVNNIHSITNINIVRPEEKFEYILCINEMTTESCTGTFKALPKIEKVSIVRTTENPIIKNDGKEKEEISTTIIKIHKPEEKYFHNITIIPNFSATSNVIKLGEDLEENYITNTKYMEMTYKEYKFDQTLTNNGNNKKYGTFKITNKSILAVFSKQPVSETSNEVIIKQFDKESSYLDKINQINFLTLVLPQKSKIIINDDESSQFVTKIGDTIKEEDFTIDIVKNNKFDYYLVIVDMEQTTFNIEACVKLSKSEEISNTSVYDEFVNIKNNEICDIKILESPINLTKLNYIWMQSHSENKVSAKDVWLKKKVKDELVNENEIVNKSPPKGIFNDVLLNINPRPDSRQSKNGKDDDISLSIGSIESVSSCERPVFISLLKDMEKNKGDSLSLKVIVLGTPLPQIVWKFNDGNISDKDENIKIISEDGISILSIKSINESNEGQYKAIAINRYGISETKCNLKIPEKSCILSNILRDEKITNDKLNKDTNKTLINTEIEINVENHICQESEKNPILCQESNIDNSNIKNTELPSNTPLVENSLTVNIKISKLEQDEEYCHINYIYPEVYTSQSQNTSTSRTVKSIRENVCYDSDETTITESLSNVSLKQLNLQEIDEEKRVETDNFPSTILEEYEYVSFVPSLLTDKKTSSLTTFYSVTENLQELLKNTDHEVQRSRVDSVTLTEKSTLSSISSLEFVHNFDSCYSQEFIPHVIDIHLHNPYKSLDTDIVIDTIRNIQLQSTFKTPKLKEKSLDESYSVISEINQFFELSFDPQKLESSFTILDKIVDDEISVKTISDMMLFPDSLSITSTTTTYNAPKFLKTLSPNSIVFENEAVILRVSFSGIPLPHITWYCNGNILLNNSICTILCEDGVSLLRISDSNILNNDDYITCQIDNAAGSEYSETKIRKLKNETRICNVNLKNINDYQGISISLLESDKANMIRDIDKSLSLELEVIENGDHNLLGGEVSLKNFYFERPIFIQELPKQIFCLENENINFKCIFKGFPEPVVTWKKNGYLLSDSGKLNIICEDGITILKLYNLIEFDSGVYECQINNGLGIEKCQCHVTIERNVKNTSTVAIEIRCCKEPQESYLGILVDEKLLNERINGSADKKNFIGFRFTEAILLNEDDTQSISSSHESLDDGNDESSPIFVTKLPEMKKITKGESIDFKVLFIGEPIPDIRWEYDSNTIKGNITKTIEDGVAIFTADNIQSDLILTCIAQNRNGTERCSCKIVLKSKADGETNNLEIGNSFNFIDIEGNVEKEVNEVMLSNKNNAAQHP